MEITGLQKTVSPRENEIHTLKYMVVNPLPTARIAEQACGIPKLDSIVANGIRNDKQRYTRRIIVWGKCTRLVRPQDTCTQAFDHLNLPFSIRGQSLGLTRKRRGLVKRPISEMEMPAFRM